MSLSIFIDMNSSLLRSLIRETLLTEEVYGAQAIVYHGTKAKPEIMIQALLDDTFTPGKGAGAMYGRGLYCVYDLSGTNTARGSYGQYVLKLNVNLYGYIIFDPEIASRVYGQSLSTAEQAKLVRLDRDVIEKLKQIEPTSSRFSSDEAQKAVEFINGRCKGIVFTGRNDGPVVVVYDPTTVIPVSWTQASQALSADPSTGVWNPVDRDMIREPIRKSLTGEWEEGKYDMDPHLMLKKSKALLRKANRQPHDRLIIKGDLNFEGVPRVTLPAGLKVEGNVFLSRTPDLTSLPDGLEVSGNLYLNYCRNLAELPENLVVGGWLYIDGTPITSLPESLQVGWRIHGFAGDPNTIPAHLRSKTFLESGDLASELTG
jgi:hypothetical protein